MGGRTVPAVKALTSTAPWRDLGSLAGSTLPESAARAPPAAPASDMPASASAPTRTRTFRLPLPTIDPRCARDLEHCSTGMGRVPSSVGSLTVAGPAQEGDGPSGDERHTAAAAAHSADLEGAPGCSGSTSSW